MQEEKTRRHLKDYPRTLDKSNIETVIENYLNLLEKIKLDIDESNVYNLLKTLKRKPLKEGPYTNVSLFEAANRIMTDLIILYGVKMLLEDPQFSEFEKYTVEYGNENFRQHDIQAKSEKRNLFGEAFNVSSSFFNSKRSKSLAKLRENKNSETDILILMYNSDAKKINRTFKTDLNQYNIEVVVDL